LKRSASRPRPSDPNASPGVAGFSLIEVLATVLLTAMLLAAFLPFVSQLLGAWTKGQSTVADNDQLSTGFPRLLTDFASALPWVDRSGQASPPPIFFFGSPTSVLFVRLANEAGIPPQLEEVYLEVSSSGATQTLIRRRLLLAGHDPVADPALMRNPVTLVTTKGDMSFAFVNPAGSRDPSWTPGPEMPTRVDLNLEHDPTMPVHQLALPIMANLPAGCLAANAGPDACPGGPPAGGPGNAGTGQPGSSAPSPSSQGSQGAPGP
jgi:type II secretory pathway component PulJ